METQTKNIFFNSLKIESEKLWENPSLIKKEIYGFQIQPGTKWLPGLTESEIEEYEKALGVLFPEEYRIFLQCMNGTDKPTVNVYGENGEQYEYGVGYYSYPRDLEKVRGRIAMAMAAFHFTPEKVDELEIPHIQPIVSHRFLVIDRCESHPVLSIHEDDVIPYGATLEEFLHDDIFENHLIAHEIPDGLQVKMWLV